MSSRGSARVRRGFTLLEAAAALLIIGMTAAAALAALSTRLRGAGRIRHALEAEALAQQRLATLRLLPREGRTRLPDSLRRGVFPAPFAEYRWHATREPARGTDDLLVLDVTIEWTEGAYRLTTYDERPRPERAVR